jgi:site-specific DNA-methyltransferase (adenine-specific)
MKPPTSIYRAPRNRTLTLTEQERLGFLPMLLKLSGPVEFDGIQNRTINQNLTDVLGWLPAQFVDLLFLDPPYNLTKTYNGSTFSKQATGEYRTWFESWFVPLLRTLKSSASVYVCADWRSSGIVQSVLEAQLKVRSRITWEREKGRHLVWHCLRRLPLQCGRSQAAASCDCPIQGFGRTPQRLD